jgi:L-ascorbate metabolism protein UlaG (beta-lactamase superfamily)
MTKHDLDAAKKSTGGWSRRALARGLAATPLLLGACASKLPADGAAGPYHHTANGFRNPPGSPTAGGDFGDWTGFFYRGMTRDAEVALPSGHVLPAAAVEAGLRADADRVAWLGHACFLLSLGGRWVITDPFLSDHASPFPPLGPKRFAPPGLRPRALPPIDILLLSHNHYDHLDLPTLEALPRAAGIKVITPLGLGAMLEGLGFADVRELDWHDQVLLDGVTATALPAIHFSKRGLFDRNQTLWAGYSLETEHHRVYFAGDTAYGPIFPELGSGLRPFDLGLVPIGAYQPRLLMQGSHVTPEEAVRIGRDLNARRLAGMHWGSIQLTDEPPFEPPARFRTAAAEAGYGDEDAWVMAIGETRII